MVEVWVPWPEESLGDKKSGFSVVLKGCWFSARKPWMKYLAPMSFRLQASVALKRSPDSQLPFQRSGIGPKPSSLKISDSGHTPVQCVTILKCRNLRD